MLKFLLQLILHITKHTSYTITLVISFVGIFREEEVIDVLICFSYNTSKSISRTSNKRSKFVLNNLNFLHYSTSSHKFINYATFIYLKSTYFSLPFNRISIFIKLNLLSFIYAHKSISKLLSSICSCMK